MRSLEDLPLLRPGRPDRESHTVEEQRTYGHSFTSVASELGIAKQQLKKYRTAVSRITDLEDDLKKYGTWSQIVQAHTKASLPLTSGSATALQITVPIDLARKLVEMADGNLALIKKVTLAVVWTQDVQDRLIGAVQEAVDAQEEVERDG